MCICCGCFTLYTNLGFSSSVFLFLLVYKLLLGCKWNIQFSHLPLPSLYFQSFLRTSSLLFPPILPSNFQNLFIKEEALSRNQLTIAIFIYKRIFLILPSLKMQKLYNYFSGILHRPRPLKRWRDLYQVWIIKVQASILDLTKIKLQVYKVWL